MRLLWALLAGVVDRLGRHAFGCVCGIGWVLHPCSSAFDRCTVVAAPRTDDRTSDRVWPAIRLAAGLRPARSLAVAVSCEVQGRLVVW